MKNSSALETIYSENISNKVVTYHGDNHGTGEISIKNMWLGGKSQEGIGIYFGTKDVAEAYGKYISIARVDPNHYLESRELTIDLIGIRDIAKLLKYCWKENSEAMYLLITDYGIYIEEVNINEQVINNLAGKMALSEIRNLQIELTERFGINTFVNAWINVLPNVHGLKHSESEFFIIINANVKVEPLNFQ